MNNTQNNLKLSELKTLLISAKNKVHSQLSLNKTKDIKYTKEDYFDCINFQSLFNTCAEDSSQTMNITDTIPSGDAIMQQLKKIEFDEIQRQSHELYKNQFYQMFPKAKKGKKYNAIVIIDVHEQETYSKEKKTNENIRGGKQKNGTNYFFKYMSMQIMIQNKILTLGVRLHRRDKTQSELVDELIMIAKEFVKIEVVLLDRGFRDVKIFNNLEYRNAPVLMPNVKDEKAKKNFEELKTKKFATVSCVMTNAKHETARVRLVMMTLNNGKQIGFYTTIKLAWLHTANYFLKLYKKRWNIETGYRLQNLFLPKTTSINECVRMFYFCYACAMHNLWLSIRQTSKLGNWFSVLKMKMILVIFWVTTHLPYGW